MFFGILLGLGIVSGKRDLTLTLIPAALAAAGVAAAIVIASRAERFAARLEPRHRRIAAAVGTVAGAVDDTKRLVFRRSDWRSLVGAVAHHRRAVGASLNGAHVAGGRRRGRA